MRPAHRPIHNRQEKGRGGSDKGRPDPRRELERRIVLFLLVPEVSGEDADVVGRSTAPGDLEGLRLEVGRWVGGWVVEKMEENEAVGMSCWTLWVAGWVEEKEAVGMSCCVDREVGGWVGGWDVPGRDVGGWVGLWVSGWVGGWDVPGSGWRRIRPKCWGSSCGPWP